MVLSITAGCSGLEAVNQLDSRHDAFFSEMCWFWTEIFALISILPSACPGFGCFLFVFSPLYIFSWTLGCLKVALIEGGVPDMILNIVFGFVCIVFFMLSYSLCISFSLCLLVLFTCCGVISLFSPAPSVCSMHSSIGFC
ncbi:hypothetical protein XENOCAPTIV_009966 [Xenoophorus captivus]|uniref:Uncharacterized protein n=1 Tax=Xenoophorus captivus TaxID=1517983 RepID=A0ABV0S1S1_9TELE